MSLRPPTPDPTAHLRPRITDRGFKHMPKITGMDGYGGKVVVYESSGATPGIWLSVETSPSEGTVVLLPLTRARQLAEQIRYLEEHHFSKEED